MKLIDPHTHLHDELYDDIRSDVIRDTLENLDKVITIGTNEKESKKALELAQKYERVFATIGIHPTYFNFSKNDNNLSANLDYQLRKENFLRVLSLFEQLISKNSKIVGIGEVGLDYYFRDLRCITDLEKLWQKETFLEQILLARKFNLPVVVHCRASKDKNKIDAYEDCYEIIKNSKNVRFVLHCYMANIEQTKRFLELDNIKAFSFAGNVTYGKIDSELNKVVKLIPNDRILVETDSPYLVPSNISKKPNFPKNVTVVARHVAKLRGVDYETFYKFVIDNTKRIFKI